MIASKSLHVDLKKDDLSNRYFVVEHLNEEIEPYAIEALKKFGFFDYSSIQDITIKEGGEISYSIPAYKTNVFSPPKNKSEFKYFLNWALMISKSISAVHQAGFCFGLLNEERFLFDENGNLIITGLGAIRKKYDSLNVTEYGKSAYRYAAPEFNSRTNHIPDQRADFYGLGILLNYWLTGNYFVDAPDGQGIMHQHLTKSYQASNDCPWSETGIFKIISGLLRKNPSERYHSALGIIKDLNSIKDVYPTGHSTSNIKLSLDYNPGVLKLDQVYCERQEELEKLVSVYNSVKNGASGVVFVEGGEGMGKSSFGRAFAENVVSPGVLFSFGKFDKYYTSAYLGFQTAFQNVVQRIFIQSGCSHKELAKAFKEGLGSDLSLLYDVMPDLQELTGKIPPPEKLDPIETQNRFINVFARYCRVLDSLGLKRVLFLDDAHCADLPSLRLIKYLMSASLSRVMFVLAYNPKDIDENHPLLQLQKELEDSKSLTATIRLKSLTKLAVKRIVGKALSEKGKNINQLAEVIFEKTRGNPYYINHFLKLIYDQEVLTFDQKTHRWNFELIKVKELEVAENVVPLVENQIALQSYQAQVLLKVAAYNNGVFDMPLLIEICGFPEKIVHLLLEILYQAGLLTKVDPSKGIFAFNHTKIQQVALFLDIPGFDFNHEELHFNIAQYKIAKGKTQSSLELNQLVDHLMKAKGLYSKNTALQALEYVIKAAEAANDSNSPITANAYLSFGLSLSRQFNISKHQFALLLGLAKTQFLLDDVDKGNALAKKAMAQARSDLQKIETLLMCMKFYEVYAHYEDNINAGLKALELLGKGFKDILNNGVLESLIQREYLSLIAMIEQIPINELVPTEQMEDHDDLIFMEVLANMSSSALFNNQDLYPLIVLKMVNHSLKKGITDSTSLALVHLGSLLISRYGKFDLGLKFGNEGVILAEKLKSDRYKTRTISIFYNLTGHFRGSFDKVHHDLDKWTSLCMDSGDMACTYIFLKTKLRNQMLSDSAFPEYLIKSSKATNFLSSLYLRNINSQISLFENNLQLLHKSNSKWNKTVEQEAIDFLMENKLFAELAEHYVHKCLAYCLLGKYGEAYEQIKSNEKFIVYATSQPHYFRHKILKSVCELMLEDNPSEAFLVSIEERQAGLKGWCNSSQENFRAEIMMVEFLISCNRQNYESAVLHLEDSLRWSENGNLKTIRALIFKLGGTLLPDNQYSFLKSRLQEVAVEEISKPKNFVNPDFQGLKMTHDERLDKKAMTSFDAQSLIKATQAISAEVNLDKLVQRLLTIVMENAGADKGALVLIKNKIPYVEALIDTKDHNKDNFLKLELESFHDLPTNLIEHAITNVKEIKINNVDQICSQKESYFKSKQIASLVLLPLLKQNDLVGMVYLENRQVPGLFAEGDLEVLRVIASQAAISITNSVLFEKAMALNKKLAISQEELAKVNVALEERIKQRTKHLQQEIEMRKEAERKLLFAKNDADSSNKAKSQFLANMSHEIRTPLNAIVGFTQILLNQGKDLNLTQKFERYLNNIHQSAESLSEVINDILDLSKIEAGKFTITKEDINLNQMVTSVCRINKGLGKSKEVNLMCNFRSNLPKYIHTDGSKLKQILMNIIGNAIKFTPEKKNVYVDVKLEKSFVVFIVEDEGIGIPENQLQQIFNPFIQADAGIDRKFGGTGLGLTITKNLIELLNGKIEVTSQLDHGTSFKIYLPYEQAKNSWVEDKETSLADFKIPPNKKILVVEDNSMNQEMIRALFAELGSEIMLAKDGESGIKITKNYNPEIVFMDIHMPDLDGFETVKRIRKMNKKVPIIGLSANAFTEHREIALNSGFCDYLTKPIQVSELVRVLKKYLFVEIEDKQQAIKILSEEEKHILNKSFNSLNRLPIFETEKLVVAAEPLNSILPPDEFNKLEEAIYSGDDEGLRILLSTTINAR
ncbi:ATP-binding protein [Allomuricauda sp. CP2A]|uniref:ATP-binding protein n=1 Tax=Allomuricauda sp. CP2A TaxID=1848189 RepID=UPI0008340CDF|nr:ATP-binding protein [Muricauda sp. CP2A]